MTIALVACVLALGTGVPADVAPFALTSLNPPTSLEAAPWECVDGDDVNAAGWRRTRVPQLQTLSDEDKKAGVGSCEGAHAWLRLTIAVPEAMRSAPLGISIGEVKGAYEVYADGARIGGLGTIEPLVDALRTGAAFPIPPEQVADGLVTVTVRVVRDGDAMRALNELHLVADGPTMVGQLPGVNETAESAVELRVSRAMTASLALSGVFLFIALYHVLVWLLRRDLRGYLWFGVFALSATSYNAIVALAGTEFLPWSARFAGVIGNFVGTLVSVTFPEFFWNYLTKTGTPRRWRIYQAVMMVVACLGFIPGVGLGLTITPPVLLLKLAMLVWAIVEFVIAARRGSREARVLITGLVLGAMGTPGQIYVVLNNLHPVVSPAQAALAVFFLQMAVALAAQFTRTLDDVDKRAKELADTNTSIQRFVPTLFLKALSKSSVREVARGDAAATTMSVMFCDLRGFTTLAEKMGPTETFHFINRYLERMEPEIHKTGGFINQYLGDGIMALFPGGADSAVDAAVGMARALETLNAERLKAGEAPLKIGIGIHTGQLMLGTIGGGDQLDSGVVGDTVNTAARLEGITKMYGAVVLISGSTMTALKNTAQRHLRPLDAVRAKGKSDALPLIEVLDCDPKPVREQKAAHRGELEAALSLYRKGKFDEAAAQFSALATACPDDAAARAFVERCAAFVAHPPEGWDGVLSLTSK